MCDVLGIEVENEQGDGREDEDDVERQVRRREGEG